MITFQKILNGINFIKKDLEENYGYLAKDKQKQILAINSKVMEEIGELSSDILSSMKMQRKAKLSFYEVSNLEKEFLDVLITVLILGTTLDIDIEKALIKRLKSWKKIND